MKLDPAFLERFATEIGPVGKSLGMLIDQLYLQERLDYNQMTGVLTWRYRQVQPGELPRMVKAWNTQYAGKRAGSVCADRGYRMLSVGGTPQLEHRVIICMMTGEWPPERSDHDNRVRHDNRWANLSPATALQNNRNASRPRHNTSGVVGVAFVPRIGKWRAEISENNKTKYLGMFAAKEAAIAVRKAAEQRLGFHPNHGAPK